MHRKHGCKIMRNVYSRIYPISNYREVFFCDFPLCCLVPCMCVCIYIYIYIYICVCVCMYVCIYVGRYTRMYICVYVCMFVCMYACVYVCIYVCMFVCMCIYVCMYCTLRDITRCRSLFLCSPKCLQFIYSTWNLKISFSFLFCWPRVLTITSSVNSSRME